MVKLNKFARDPLRRPLVENHCNKTSNVKLIDISIGMYKVMAIYILPRHRLSSDVILADDLGWLAIEDGMMNQETHVIADITLGIWELVACDRVSISWNSVKTPFLGGLNNFLPQSSPIIDFFWRLSVCVCAFACVCMCVCGVLGMDLFAGLDVQQQADWGRCNLCLCQNRSWRRHRSRWKLTHTQIYSYNSEFIFLNQFKLGIFTYCMLLKSFMNGRSAFWDKGKQIPMHATRK